MGILLAGGILGPIVSLFGLLMNGIYKVLGFIGINNIGLCIVLYTAIIYMLMLPMQIRQQKFTRISSIMNPEIQAIQKKYKNKKDQASMLKMQEETKMVYQKYGTSPMGGCLGSLIQLPFLFALWPVIQNIGEYVKITNEKHNYFFGISYSETPSYLFSNGNTFKIIVAVAIPVLAAFTQWLSIRVSQTLMESGNKKDDENAMAKQMGMMTKIMPLTSLIIGFSMPVGLGIYWIASAVVRTLQQVFINKSLMKKPVEELVQENVKRAEKKLNKKKSVDSKNVNSMAKMYTRKLDEMKAEIIAEADEKEKKEKQRRESTYRSNAKPGSLASKANLVSDYNNRNNK